MSFHRVASSSASNFKTCSLTSVEAPSSALSSVPVEVERPIGVGPGAPPEEGGGADAEAEPEDDEGGGAEAEPADAEPAEAEPVAEEVAGLLDAVELKLLPAAEAVAGTVAASCGRGGTAVPLG